jgi:bifunctional DNase/RNase
MITLSVKDVLGPLPSDGTCMVIASAGGKTFALQCGHADAETCHGLLNSESFGGPSPYEFMVKILDKFHVSVTRSEVEAVNGAFYSKVHFKSSRMRNPLKAVSGNPMAAINSSLASGKSVTVNKEFVAAVVDVSGEYASLKNVIGTLWPLPAKLTSTESLKVLSEFIDQAQLQNATKP